MQWPQLTNYKSTTERHGGNPLFLSKTHLSSWLPPSFLTAFSMTAPNTQMHTVCIFFFSQFVSVFSRLFFSRPLLHEKVCASGIMTMVILFWASVSPWLVEKWLKSEAQTQYVVSVESTNTTLALLLARTLAEKQILALEPKMFS